MRKKNGRKWFIVGVLVLAGFFAWKYWGGAGEGGDAGAHGGPRGGMPAMPVTIAQPERKEISDWDEYTGRFEAADMVEVRARVGGYLDSVHFEEGSTVRKGDLLFVIDPRPFAANLKQAQADERAAATRVALATVQFKRAEQLIKSGTIAQSAYDERKQLQQEAAALREAAQAGLERAKLDMEFTHVRAPVSGRISRKLVTEGNLITGGTANSTLLTTIVSLDPIQFYFDIDEQSYLRYQRLTQGGWNSGGTPSAQVEVALMDEKEFTHKGRVDFIDNRIDSGTGTLRGRATFPNGDMRISPGMFGRARLQGSGTYNAILVRDEAIMTDQAWKFVYIVDDTGAVSTRDITPGPLSGGLRVVREGLSGNEWIIIKGLQRAREGAKVQAEKGAMRMVDASSSEPSSHPLSNPPPRAGGGGAESSPVAGSAPGVTNASPPPQPLEALSASQPAASRPARGEGVKGGLPASSQAAAKPKPAPEKK